MTVQIKAVQTFHLTSVVGDQTFTFQIAAASQQEACSKLTGALGRIIDDLNALPQKVGAS